MRSFAGSIEMIRRLILVGVLGVAGSAWSWGQTVIPDTPAGHTLQAWLEAFNSGDQAKLDAYTKNVDKTGSFATSIEFRKQTGGFDLLAIEDSEPLSIQFKIKEKAGSTVAFGTMEVKDGQPVTVKHIDLIAAPPDAVFEKVKLDGAKRKLVIEGVDAKLTESYVYPDLAQKMVDALQVHEKHGDYDAVTEGGEFASLLTEHLRDVSHDKHLNVRFTPFKQPAEAHDHTPSAEDEARMKKQMERDNCAFRKVEVLGNNVGYVKFDAFMDPNVCGPTVVAAMNFVGHADGIIFDLRENGGGDPKMVALVLSYLFKEPTHVNDLYNRKEDSTEQYWTSPYVPGPRLDDKPVFVLTSKDTFSGGEEFTYDLKELKRATIVGETTGGGAHPVRGLRVDDHFTVGVPFARAVNPVSKTNWEGTGVAPDVSVKASEALETAEKLMAEKLQKK
jgi:retinol-binding protein 3